MLKPVDFRNGRVVVELGSGTGAVTREILKRLPVEGRLYAFDVNFNFIRHLRSTCRDPRLIVVHTNAENLLTTLSGLGVNGVSAVISSLGLTGMSPDQRNQILHQAATCLEAGGVMTQFQYVGGFAKCPSNSKFRIRRFRERQFLRHFFRSVSVEPVLFNLPPAMVFTCRK